MERSEPALVPEWLRNSGNVAGGGSSSHHLVPSSSHTDAASLAHHTRNRISKSSSDFDNPRSAYLERSSSSNSRRISSNGSGKHAYSSFNRSHRDKDRDREKERSCFGDNWDCNGSDPLETIFSGRIEKDTLRRSHSMVARKPVEVLPRRTVTDAKISNSSNLNNGNLSGGSVGASIQKAVFEKDFPSLGTEEKPGVSDIIRVLSPVLSTTSQSLPVGSSALIGGEGWTSALAEVPSIIGSGSPGSLCGQQIVAATSVSAASSAIASLNMAEALVQNPSRARTAPQVSVKTQRLEELAIKQSRQLIPVTPLTPKALVLNSSEKSKPKAAARNVETIAATKVGLQQPTSLHMGNQAIRGGNPKPDSSMTSGKLVVLKPRENGVSVASKDAVNSTNNAASRVGNQNLLIPSVAPANLKSTNSEKPTLERKAAPGDPKSGSTLEKRPSLSQVQSRNDFFNLIKKKTSLNISSPESGPVPSLLTVGKSSEVTAPSSPHALENGLKVDGHGDTCDEVNRLPDCEQKDMAMNAAIYPDEEEAAFLRSLGWEENSGEEEGLTEEEINAFFHQYMKLRPTLKLCQGIQPKLSMLSESFNTDSGEATTDLSSTDASES